MRVCQRVRIFQECRYSLQLKVIRCYCRGNSSGLFAKIFLDGLKISTLTDTTTAYKNGAASSIASSNSLVGTKYSSSRLSWSASGWPRNTFRMCSTWSCACARRRVSVVWDTNDCVCATIHDWTIWSACVSVSTGLATVPKSNMGASGFCPASTIFAGWRQSVLPVHLLGLAPLLGSVGPVAGTSNSRMTEWCTTRSIAAAVAMGLAKMRSHSEKTRFDVMPNDRRS